MQPIACPIQTRAKVAKKKIAIHVPNSKSVTVAAAKVIRYAQEMFVARIPKYVNRITVTVLLESIDTVTFIVDVPSHMKVLNKNFQISTKFAWRINAMAVYIHQMHFNAINALKTIKNVIWWVTIH